MKTRFVPGSLLIAFALATAVPNRAQTTSPAPPAQRELAVVVVESLNHPHGATSDFDRFDMAFTAVAKQRKWPLKIVAERFAANTPAHETELRIFFKGIREEIPGELTFRAWMTFADHDAKRDFGIVTFRYYPRVGQQRDDVLENVFLGAANAGADKIEPLLFPMPPAPKN